MDSPLDFMQQIYEILDETGFWIFEQAYMPFILERKMYDSICHEHLEYYSLSQIEWMAKRTGFKIIDVEFNNTNGGSFSVVVSKSHASWKEKSCSLDELISKEQALLSEVDIYRNFNKRILEHRDKLKLLIKKIRDNNKLIIGYGASTKGNVLLQYCGFTKEEIPYIADVNESKFGCLTPGTHIPIISEEEAKRMNPDYLFVLPWHFKDSIIKKEQEFLNNGGKLIIPLPEIEIIEKG